VRDTPSKVNNTDCIICFEVSAVKCNRCQCHKRLLAVADCFCIGYSSGVLAKGRVTAPQHTAVQFEMTVTSQSVHVFR